MYSLMGGDVGWSFWTKVSRIGNEMGLCVLQLQTDSITHVSAEFERKGGGRLCCQLGCVQKDYLID